MRRSRGRVVNRADYEALRATPEARALRDAAEAWPRGPVESSAPDRRLLDAAIHLAGRMTALPSPAMSTKDKVAQFRTTSARFAAYTAAADRCDMTLSEWLDHVAAAAAGESDLLRDLERARKHAAKLERKR